ncbi:hypothetical protein HELRODRAFT_126208, partial [Helobdella robusta]|uniref:EF-hand domain-containing protein n=1 Tax=Helobdella robusta TaxID=6412 RepID=T1EH86_HELRO
DELKKLAERFTKLDQNRDGVISRDEIMAVPGLETNPLTDRLIELFDSDQNGTIDFNEFINGMSKISMKGDATTKLQFAFSIYDTNNDGYITNGELYYRLKSLIGKNVDDEMLQQIVDKTIVYNDKDNDGKINIKEFTDV